MSLLGLYKASEGCSDLTKLWSHHTIKADLQTETKTCFDKPNGSRWLWRVLQDFWKHFADSGAFLLFTGLLQIISNEPKTKQNTRMDLRNLTLIWASGFYHLIKFFTSLSSFSSPLLSASSIYPATSLNFALCYANSL